MADLLNWCVDDITSWCLEGSDLELFPNNPAFLGPRKDWGAWILRIFASKPGTVR